MTAAQILGALENHLWQSTVFAVCAALLVLALRKNQARIRYWVWLAASIKFLVPFSLLVWVGGHLGSLVAPDFAAPRVSTAVERISQPLMELPALSMPAPSSRAAGGAGDVLPLVVLAIWLAGSCSVLIRWRVKWRRLRAVVRQAKTVARRDDVPVLASPLLIEPGVFGIVRPVLLLPEGITERLAAPQLGAVLAHEMCHVRRRDNLTAAIHMLVEAMFWFHPLIWWLGARLIEERERACDEAVLQLGNEPRVYAEGILKTCEYYLESPLACASGVTGADLKKRIGRIMKAKAACRLAVAKRILLTCAAIASVAGPMGFGLLTMSRGRAQAAGSGDTAFEVASVKPNKSGDWNVQITVSPGGRFRATNVSLKMLIRVAYKVQDFQISGATGWVESERYDVEAKGSGGPGDDAVPASEEQRKAAEERRRRQLQNLLADRFHLKIRWETREGATYGLLAARNGPKLEEALPSHDDMAVTAGKGASGPAGKGRGLRMGRGQLSGKDVPLAMLAEALSTQLGRPVVDQTGLKGMYDFTLKWTPDESQAQMFKGAGADAAPPPDPSAPGLFTALQEQLGLKLESQKGPIEMLAIENVEKPSAN